MRVVHGVAQHYAWGDTRAIPDVLGQPVDGRPWAEWWIGTHPGGPATMEDGRLLRDAAGELPYLVKLLAAAEPLSLQTHPDSATAQAGFQREDRLGIALDDPARIYRDLYAKPEILCALTDFDALCGFRPVDETAALLRSLGLEALADELRADGLEAVVGGLYRRTIDSAPVVRACTAHDAPEAALVGRLDAQYPGDASVAVTLFLNRVRLQPGQAIHLTPGNLHAYLHGLGVEVMGASDNVVRGGLTPKHVDVDELLRVLRFEPLTDPVVSVTEVDQGVWQYATPDAPFRLRRLDVRDTAVVDAEGAEVVLCTDGDQAPLRRGQAAVLVAGESLTLHGPCTVWHVAPA